MISSIRSRVPAAMPGYPLMTLDTVAADTPAIWAIWATVTSRRWRPPSVGSRGPALTGEVYGVGTTRSRTGGIGGGTWGHATPDPAPRRTRCRRRPGPSTGRAGADGDTGGGAGALEAEGGRLPGRQASVVRQ